VRLSCVNRFDLVIAPTIFVAKPKLRPTKIVRDAKFGARFVILAGLKIEDGAIIAEASLITRSVSACDVHGGVHNRELQNHFDDTDDIVAHLAYLRLSSNEGIFAERQQQFYEQSSSMTKLSPDNRNNSISQTRFGLFT
jgi:hypothetical protein